MRYFNTSGPVVAEDHYHVPPLARTPQSAPSSKSWPRRPGTRWATRAWAEIWPDVLARAGGHSALRTALTRWCRASEKLLVLLIDEIDTLVGDSLLAVLRQLRAGYDLRPEGFPQSVVLCGVRDVCDYPGGSAFNIKAESLRLDDFTQDDVRALLRQHTSETGQPFAEGALEAVWNQTQGSPGSSMLWPTRRASEASWQPTASRVATETDVLAAREELILRRDTTWTNSLTSSRRTASGA